MNMGEECGQEQSGVNLMTPPAVEQGIRLANMLEDQKKHQSLTLKKLGLTDKVLNFVENAVRIQSLPGP
jgi:hypothetical protein